MLNEKIDLRDTIPKIENALSHIPEVNRIISRTKIQKVMKKKLEMEDKDQEDIKALKNIKKNKYIACIHSDKTGK